MANTTAWNIAFSANEAPEGNENKIPGVRTKNSTAVNNDIIG
jgi:hypothetical protein